MEDLEDSEENLRIESMETFVCIDICEDPLCSKAREGSPGIEKLEASVSNEALDETFCITLSPCIVAPKPSFLCSGNEGDCLRIVE